MKVVRKILIVFFASVLGILTLAVTLSLVYEKRIREYLVSSLNEQIEGKITTGDITFSLVRKFPFASLKITDLEISPADAKLPDLYKAQTTFLEFNVLDMFSGNYSIRNIDIRHGSIYVFSENGKSNYKLFKESGNKNENFSLALRKLRASDLKVKVEDRNNRFLVSASLKNVALKGRFSDREYELSSELTGKIDKLLQGDVTWLNSRKVTLNSELIVKNNTYTISRSDLSIQGLKFNIEGTITNEPQKLLTDLTINGNSIQLIDLFTILPSSYIPSTLDNYGSEGDLDFSAVIKGSGEKTSVNADYQIRKGKLTYKPEKLELKNISLRGSITNGKETNMRTTRIQVSDFYADTKAGRVSGNFVITDPSAPHLNANVKAVAHLQNILPFVNEQRIEKGEGKFELHAHYEGKLSKASSARDLQKVHSGGILKFTDLKLKLKGNDQEITNLSGSLLLDKNDLIVQGLTVSYGGGNYVLKGNLENLIPSIFLKEEKLKAALQVSADQVDLTAFVRESEKEKKDTTLDVIMLPFAEARFVLDLGKAKYKKFEASNINGTIEVTGDKIKTSGLTFHTMDGEVEFTAVASMTENGLSVTGRSKMQRINVSKLFYQMDNFGQETVTDKHLKGVAVATIEFGCNWNQQLQFDPASLSAICDLTIDQGELNNFEPLYHLSKYVALSELRNVRFSRLQNKFIVKDEKIVFPGMTIQSNALNLECSGTHYFSNKVDYHFTLALNELLSQKAKKAKSENEEFGEVEDDGLGKINLHLSMTGDVSAPVLAYDKRGFKDNLKKDVQNEKLLVKGLLKNELGIYKGDSTVKAPAAKKEKALQVDWEGSESTNKSKAKAEVLPEKEKPKGKVGKLLEKAGKGEKEKSSGQTSDDFN